MRLIFGFFIVSVVLCVLVNLGALVAEKVQKKKMEKIAKEQNK